MRRVRRALRAMDEPVSDQERREADRRRDILDTGPAWYTPRASSLLGRFTT